ncbi:MAG: creatininase family protein, partial [Armatimonadota bacterium]|nr:creatininase family protein [Armatimonadota bacterium]
MLKSSPVDLIRLSTNQAGALLRKTAAAVLPTGSLEQHGPHLPCGTDFIAAYLIGEEVARRCNALLVPFCPLGVTPFHLAFPGTITLSPGTYALVLQETIESLVRHGLRRCVVVNWHEGNTGAIHMAADVVQKAFPVRVYVVQAAYVAQILFGRKVGLTHGGLLEV